jgi:hypothetical protein
MQVAGEDLVHAVEVRAHREQVFHRPTADVEQEDIAVAQLDVPGRGLLGARDRRRHAGAQRDDEHLVRSDLFGTRIPGGRFLARSVLCRDFPDGREAPIANLGESEDRREHDGDTQGGKWPQSG